jgi:hypothetical protein
MLRNPQGQHMPLDLLLVVNDKIRRTEAVWVNYVRPT